MDPVVHFEMPAQDMKRAKRFYERVFDWDVLPAYDSYFYAHTASETGDDNMSQTPGEINGAIQQRDNTIGALRMVIRVADLDAALEKVLQEGGRIFIPKKRIPHMYYSVIYDTEGNEVNLVQFVRE